MKLSTNKLINQWQIKGYVELPNELYNKQWYAELYQNFDQFILKMENDPKFATIFRSVGKELMDIGLHRTLGNSSVGYIDGMSRGKSKKVSFHYSPEFYRHIYRHYSNILNQCPPLALFMAKMSELSTLVDLLFQRTIKNLEKKFLDIRNVMYSDRFHLAIVIKVVRYSPDIDRGCNPHYDFSSLTVLLDNSNSGLEDLKIAPFSDHLSLSDFHRIKRIYGRIPDGSSSMLVIPGLGLSKHGISIQPTPHLVEPISSVRYATIAFAMVPYSAVSNQEIKLSLD